MPKKQDTKSKKTTQSTGKKKQKKEKSPSVIEELRATLKHGETWRFSVGIILFVCALFLFAAFVSYMVNGHSDQSLVESGVETQGYHNWGGKLGAVVGYFFMERGFGLLSFFIPLFLLAFSFKLIGVCRIKLHLWFINCALVMIWGSLTLSFIGHAFPHIKLGKLTAFGGNHGEFVRQQLESNIGNVGIILIILLSAILYLVYLSGETIRVVRKVLNPTTYKPSRSPEASDESTDALQNEESLSAEVKEEEQPTDVPDLSNATVVDLDDEPVEEVEKPVPSADPSAPSDDEISFDIEKTVGDDLATGKNVANPLEVLGPYDPRKDLEHYSFPPLSLLKKYDTSGAAIDMDEQRQNKELIVNVLHDFGVDITSIKATIGPTITLYELTLAQSVRISKIKTLSDDIALRLRATGVRIIAPIPGKGTVGIEVPNANPQIVSMESILNSRKFQDTNFALPVALGKTITNDIFMVDLAKMPHMLIAGATGQGKSVGLNAIITSLLYKKHPSELKIVLVDPKKVEFSMYEGIEKHFLAKIPSGEDPIITDTSRVVQTLKSLCNLMDHRYDLLKKAHCKNIKEYNEKFCRRQLNPAHGHEFLPYIVIVIDEYGDLIMTAGKEVELPIQRITQLARAVGMHMVLATQRPTTNIITGTIKANCPARIAFRVSSMIDSRTILDQPGANKLVGKGDMLFLNGMEPVRVQCAFVDTPEVENIVEHISRQQGYMAAYELPEVAEESEDGKGGEGNPVDRDSMFNEVAEYIVMNQQGSTSLIQRKFSIGYNRAGRLMDQMEASGIVGPARGAKPREVLIRDLDSLHRILG